MQRRSLCLAALALAPALVALPAAHAGSLDAFSGAQAGQALRAALERGAATAVGALGVPGGFMNDERLRIPLPDGLRQAERLLRTAGMGRDLDELIAAMNRAAEAAVPAARQLLSNAIRSMTLDDAKGILAGGDDSVTQFFERTTRSALTERFLPAVTRAVERIGLAQRYNALAGRAAAFGLLRPEEASVQRHVTGRALDGLYLRIADEERAIRQDPVRAGTDIARRVFGALR